jgi:hypothetical protein
LTDGSRKSEDACLPAGREDAGIVSSLKFKEGCKLQVAGCRLQLQVSGCRLQVAVASFRLQVSGCKLQVSGFRFQVAGCRFQVAVASFRLQVAGFRLQVCFKRMLNRRSVRILK